MALPTLALQPHPRGPPFPFLCLGFSGPSALRGHRKLEREHWTEHLGPGPAPSQLYHTGLYKPPSLCRPAAPYVGGDGSLGCSLRLSRLPHSGLLPFSPSWDPCSVRYQINSCALSTFAASTEYSPRALGEIRDEGFPCFHSGPPTLHSAGLGCPLLSGSPLPSPTKEQHQKLSSDEMYLLDSGGQYWYVFPTLPWPTTSAQTSGASQEPAAAPLPGCESSV